LELVSISLAEKESLISSKFVSTIILVRSPSRKYSFFYIARPQTTTFSSRFGTCVPAVFISNEKVCCQAGGGENELLCEEGSAKEKWDVSPFYIRLPLEFIPMKIGAGMTN